MGLFDVQDGNGNTEKRVKIINTASTFTASWDSSRYVSNTDHINWGYGINQWGESKYSNGETYEGANLMRLLNGYYIGKNGSTCTYCNGETQETCTNTCDANSLKTSKMKVLTNTSKQMIKNAVWDTYAVGDHSLPTEAYLQEKGLTTQYTGKSECVTNGNVDNCNDSVERTTIWTGQVGLMSVSDITYANGWLYSPSIDGQMLYPWSISPIANSDGACDVWGAGEGSGGSTAGSHGGVWPAAYLSSNVQIIGGDGSEGNAYKLKLNSGQ